MMFAFGIHPRAFAGLFALSALFALAGCASNPNSGAQYAAVTPPASADETIELEGDGLPAQAAPPIGVRDLPDDPSEPFSPNYGGPNPAASDRYERYETLPPGSEPPEAEPPAPPARTAPSAFRNKVAEAHDAH